MMAQGVLYARETEELISRAKSKESCFWDKEGLMEWLSNLSSQQCSDYIWECFWEEKSIKDIFYRDYIYPLIIRNKKENNK